MLIWGKLVKIEVLIVMEIQQLHCIEQSMMYLCETHPRADQVCSAVPLPSTSGLISLKHFLQKRLKVKKYPLKPKLIHQKATKTVQICWVLSSQCFPHCWVQIEWNRFANPSFEGLCSNYCLEHWNRKGQIKRLVLVLFPSQKGRETIIWNYLPFPNVCFGTYRWRLASEN